MSATTSSRSRPAREQSLHGGTASPPYPWYVTAALMACGAVLLTLAFAPAEQFYLAWLGPAALLVAVHGPRSLWRTFLWAWGGGTLFFAVNMWWLGLVTLPGAIALIVYLGAYWGLLALVVRGCSLMARPPVVAAAYVAAAWCGLEFLRGNLFTGLPWLYLGHTQSPFLAAVQIADALGAYGVSFWVAMINAAVALAVLRGVRAAAPAMAAAAVVMAAVTGYGLWRLSQQTTTPGPRVLVVQGNYPQSTGGDKGASYAEMLAFHVGATQRHLEADGEVDLVVWSETVLAPLNEEARQVMRDSGARFLDQTHDAVARLARQYGVNILVGATYAADWREVTDPKTGRRQSEPMDRRNSAYLFHRDGRMDQRRYDKIHLVPFGEYMPFKQTIPWLHRAFMLFNPYPYDYTLTAGDQSAMTVFEIADRPGKRTWRFVVPICFEDIDSRLLARMMRQTVNGTAPDFIVNITNDGWFRANQNSQHLQAAAFRSIENRAPTARSVNTGISGFVDSSGRIDRRALVPQGTDGVSAATLALDGRRPLYTRVGDLFAGLCVLVTCGPVIRAAAGRYRRHAASRVKSVPRGKP